MTDPSLPVVEPPFDPTADVAVSGVLLAAGTSSRFGTENKLLATLSGRPLVSHAAESLVAADLTEVIVVVGYDPEAVRAAIDAPVRFVHNEDYAAGQATSLRAGLSAVDDGADAALFALGDMPAVDPGTIETLVAAFGAGAGDPLAAAYDGTRGNPVLFGSRYFERLADVEGDTGGRSILLEAPDAALVETGDPGVLRDVDRPADL